MIWTLNSTALTKVLGAVVSCLDLQSHRFWQQTEVSHSNKNIFTYLIICIPLLLFVIERADFFVFLQLHITLTDEDDIPNAIGNLHVIYPNLMKLDYDNKRTRSNMQIDGIDKVESKEPLELFSEFYEKQNNQPMSEEQLRFLQKLIEKIWEDEA